MTERSVVDAINGLSREDLSEILRAYKPSTRSLTNHPENFQQNLREEFFERLARQVELGVSPMEIMNGLMILTGAFHAALLSSIWHLLEVEGEGDDMMLNVRAELEALGIAARFEQQLEKATDLGMKVGGAKCKELRQAKAERKAQAEAEAQKDLKTNPKESKP